MDHLHGARDRSDPTERTAGDTEVHVPDRAGKRAELLEGQGDHRPHLIGPPCHATHPTPGSGRDRDEPEKNCGTDGIDRVVLSSTHLDVASGTGKRGDGHHPQLQRRHTMDFNTLRGESMIAATTRPGATRSAHDPPPARRGAHRRRRSGSARSAPRLRRRRRPPRFRTRARTTATRRLTTARTRRSTSCSGSTTMV